MRIKEFLFLFSKSFSPLHYKELVTRRKRDVVKYFLYLITFSVLLSGITSLPKIMHMPQTLDNTMSKFQTFNITGVDIKMSEPVMLLNNPKTVLDLTPNRTDLDDEKILITSDEIIWRQVHPDLFGMKLYATEKQNLSQYKDVLAGATKLRNLYWLLFLMILPSLFFIILMLNLIKYFMLVMLFTFLGIIFQTIRKQKFKPLIILRLAVFSISLMVVLDVVISPLFNFGYLGLITYILLFLLGNIIVFGKKLEVKDAR